MAEEIEFENRDFLQL